MLIFPQIKLKLIFIFIFFPSKQLSINSIFPLIVYARSLLKNYYYLSSFVFGFVCSVRWFSCSRDMLMGAQQHTLNNKSKNNKKMDPAVQHAAHSFWHSLLWIVIFFSSSFGVRFVFSFIKTTHHLHSNHFKVWHFTSSLTTDSVESSHFAFHFRKVNSNTFNGNKYYVLIIT